ncbi:MAG: calcium-binding protein [Anaerolineales bacterium]
MKFEGPAKASAENPRAKEMFVLIRWESDGLAVPLSQLTPINATETQTKEAVGDWHYWVDMGYQFG